MSDDFDDQSEFIISQLVRAQELESRMRGKFLSTAVSLENRLEVAIAAHFCFFDNDREALITHVLKRLDYSRKKEALGTVSRDFYPDINDKFASLQGDLREISEMRNKLAHLESELDLDLNPDPYADDEVEYLNVIVFKNGKKVIERIEKTAIDSMVNRISNTIAILTVIASEIHKRKEIEILSRISDLANKHSPNN